MKDEGCSVYIMIRLLLFLPKKHENTNMTDFFVILF